MKLYAKDKQYTLYNGNMLDMLDVLEPNSIDAIICDPPYELNFMSKGWDRSGIAFSKEAWEKCLEVLKPGGHLLAFGGSRTYHRIACAIEDAGFEIRDCIMWLYGSGFPKSQNIGKQIDAKLKYGKANSKSLRQLEQAEGTNPHTIKQVNNGIMGEMKEIVRKDYESTNQYKGWGTCLKPAYEPIVMARKPFKGSLTDNVLKYGVGGLNIDGCRVGKEIVGGGTMPDLDYIGKEQVKQGNGHKMSFGQVSNAPRIKCEEHEGRFPANVIHDGSDEVTSGMPNGSHTGNRSQQSIENCIELRKIKKGSTQCDIGGNIDHITEYTDEGSVSRYFYCAKASKKDRDEGMDMFKIKQCVGGGGGIGNYLNDVNSCSGKFGSEKAPHRNFHPTVKPIELMQYLIRLVTPKGGTILDCFMGSGSTGKAAMFENRERNANYHFIGIELTDEYLPICKARIDYAINKYEYDLKQKEIETGQMNLFDFSE